MVKEKHWPFKIYPIQFIALGFAVIILIGYRDWETGGGVS